MCNCQPILNEPGRCVLNGLYTEPVPEELSSLNNLETQFIQRTKCFQTVVRLGMYTGKVPLYNSLKAVKGTMFFLPLPLQNTLGRLDEAGFKAEYSSEEHSLSFCLTQNFRQSSYQTQNCVAESHRH